MKINSIISNFSNQKYFSKTKSSPINKTNPTQSKQSFDTVSFGSYEYDWELKSDKCIFEGLIEKQDLFFDKTGFLSVGARSLLAKDRQSDLEQAFTLAERIDEEENSDSARRTLLNKFFEQDDETILRKFAMVRDLCASVDEYNGNIDETTVLFNKIVQSPDKRFDQYYAAANKLAEKIDEFNGNKEAQNNVLIRLINCNNDEVISKRYQKTLNLIKEVNKENDGNELIENFYFRMINGGDELFNNNFYSILSLAKDIDGINENTDAKNYLLDNLLEDDTQRRSRNKRGDIVNLAIQIDKENRNTLAIQKLKNKLESSKPDGYNTELIRDCNNFIWLDRVFDLDYEDFKQCAGSAWQVAKETDKKYGNSTMLTRYFEKITPLEDEEFLKYMDYIKDFSENSATYLSSYTFHNLVKDKYKGASQMIMTRFLEIKDDDLFLENAKYIQSYAKQTIKTPKALKEFIERLENCDNKALAKYINTEEK